MSFEGGEQPDTGVALGGADPILAWLIEMKGTQDLGPALLSGCRHLVHHPQEYYCLSDFFGAAFNAG